MQQKTNALAYSILELMRATGIKSRTTIQREINSGRLKIVKVGRRTIITAPAAREWLRRLGNRAA